MPKKIMTLGGLKEVPEPKSECKTGEEWSRKDKKCIPKKKPKKKYISSLIGFVRKHVDGDKIKVSISKEALENIEPYLSKAGEPFYSLVIDTSNLEQVIEGEKEVTSITYIEKLLS